MPHQQVDTDTLKKAEAIVSLAKDSITQAIEQSASNQVLCEEALKQASNDISQAQTMLTQVQSAFQTAQTLSVQAPTAQSENTQAKQKK
jgi:hypothetical protein